MNHWESLIDTVTCWLRRVSNNTGPVGEGRGEGGGGAGREGLEKKILLTLSGRRGAPAAGRGRSPVGAEPAAR